MGHDPRLSMLSSVSLSFPPCLSFAVSLAPSGWSHALLPSGQPSSVFFGHNFVSFLDSTTDIYIPGGVGIDGKY